MNLWVSGCLYTRAPVLIHYFRFLAYALIVLYCIIFGQNWHRFVLVKIYILRHRSNANTPVPNVFKMVLRRSLPEAWNRKPHTRRMMPFWKWAINRYLLQRFFFCFCLFFAFSCKSNSRTDVMLAPLLLLKYSCSSMTAHEVRKSKLFTHSKPISSTLLKFLKDEVDPMCLW